MLPGRERNPMDVQIILPLVLAILGSNALAVWLTNFFQRRKMSSEVDKATVENALAIESRAVERYHTTAEALTEAERLLRFARQELAAQAEYILSLQKLLRDDNIPYPKQHEIGLPHGSAQ